MKNTILVLAALFIFPSCKENTKTQKMSDLTSTNYITTMLKTIKHYDDEPLYQLHIKNSWCFSEILVNDIPAYKNFQSALRSPIIDINNYIFKSGLQKVSIRMYPVGKYEDENIDSFIAETGISISVIMFNEKMKKDTEIIKYSTPKKEEENDSFIGIGKTYYEASFTFEAKVPYEFNSLEKGQDLRKWNQEKLEKKVIDFYKIQWKLINEKKIDQYFSFLELKEKETCQSDYNSKSELEENLNAYLEPFTDATFKLEPLENYKLKLYGEGKIVCLELNSNEAIKRGKSALWGKYKKDDYARAKFRKYYLYIPQGEEELVIIR